MARPSPLMTCALALALAVAPAAARASTENPAAAETKHAEAKSADAKPAETKAAPAKPVEAKAGETKAVGAKPNDAKPNDAKPGDAKVGEAKPGAEKAEGKSKDGKSEPDKADEGEPAPAKPVRPKPLKKVASKEPPKNLGEGPSPASPPPMTMGGLRDEIRRENAVGRIDPGASPRTKVEQMLTEIVKTREALHAETLRLEGMMAQEGPEGTGTPPAGAANNAAATGGKPAKHPLDILAKALRAIKPEQAAPIVSRLDKRLAATVLQRMPPVDAGKIMGAMKPDTAAELATQIAMRVPGAERGEGRK